MSHGCVPDDTIDEHGLDERAAALAWLAVLVALRASPASYRACVQRALAAGASVDDVIDTLKAVAPSVGLARVVAAAPGLALALGYDIDRALETLDMPAAGAGAGPTGGDGDGRRRGAGTADTADDVDRP
jgi:alkylhydroperoxidase/carboxymuconolactone decarboxylase family protein YurZ